MNPRSAIPRAARALCLLGLMGLVGPTTGCVSVEAGRHLEAGNAALDAGRPAQAVAHFEAAIAVWPEASELHNHLGIALAADGRHRAALAAFERAVALDCDNQAAQQNLANARAVAASGLLDGPGPIP